MVQATAPGKIILFGEHAVVYGRPAIAAPVSQVRATATIEASQTITRLIAPDLGMNMTLAEADEGNPIAAAVRQVAAAVTTLPPLKITVRSSIPIASGMGSGAAISAAIIRAITEFMNWPVSHKFVSDMTYEVEKIHHGTPSGIDNTVVAYERPVYFVRQPEGNRIEKFLVKRPLHLLIADTGIKSSTKVAVADVRRQWQDDPYTFEALFDVCGQIASSARTAIEAGDLERVGRLMRENHTLLQKITVSSPELDRLVDTATKAGALGAKLSGAGRGGNMIALVANKERETAVKSALIAAGATAVLTTTIQ